MLPFLTHGIKTPRFISASGQGCALLLVTATAQAQVPPPTADPTASEVPPQSAAPTSSGAPSETSANAPTSTESKAAEGEPTAPPPEAAAAATASPSPEAPQQAEPPKTSEQSSTLEDEQTWAELRGDDEEKTKAAASATPHDSLPKFRTLLLIEGTGKYGGITIAAPEPAIGEEETEDEVLSAAQVGGQVTLGVMPSGGAFTMAGRLRGGTYFGDGLTWGNVALEALFGAQFSRRGDASNFSYVLGGVGVELLPSVSQDLLTLNFAGGFVINGLDLSAGLNMAGNDEYATVMLGLHVGWGSLY